MIKLGIFAHLRDKENPDQFVDTEDFIGFARELNVDSIDLFLGRGLSSTDPEYLRRIKIKCIKAGLPIGYVASGVGLAGPEDVAAGKVDIAKRDVDVASFLGAQLVHVFARGGKLPEDDDEYEALWAQMVQRMQKVCEYAAQKGIIVGVQNHDNGSWLMEGEQVIRLLKDVGRENFSFLMDTGQWKGSKGSHPRGVIKDTVNPDVHEEHIKLTAPYATHVRAKIYKVDSGREEYLDYGRLIRILKDVDYNGTVAIVLEHQGTQFDDIEAMRRAVKHLRSLL